MATEAQNATSGVCLDLEQAAAVMGRSWRENKEQALRYTPEFLRSCVAYPGKLPVITSALYERDELAAFVFGFSRAATLSGRELNLLLMTFFTVAPEFKGRGLGVKVWAECIKRARAAGYDGVLYYCVEGNRSNGVTAAGCRAAGYELRRVFGVSYLMRILRPGEASGTESDAPQLSDVDLTAFQSAAARIGNRVPLARKWSAEEARWQCLERTNGLSVTAREGSSFGALFGALTGYAMQIADDRGTKCVFLEDVLWGDLTETGKRLLVKTFIARCSASAQIAVLPILRYFEIEPFLDAGFRRSTRVLNCYLALWNHPPISELSGLYMDVI